MGTLATMPSAEVQKNGLSWDEWLARVCEYHNRRAKELSLNDLAFLKNRFKEGKAPKQVHLA